LATSTTSTTSITLATSTTLATATTPATSTTLATSTASLYPANANRPELSYYMPENSCGRTCLCREEGCYCDVCLDGVCWLLDPVPPCPLGEIGKLVCNILNPSCTRTNVPEG
jgi:hypothetical protein